jgi:glycosyltransferase involved in cell wall biosynthesis
MVVTLHDLSFERHPEWFGRGRRLAYAAQARWAARTARAVITVSHYVADDLMRTYGVRGERIFVARHGVDGLFRDDRDNTAVRTRLGIDEQYVVAIGGGPRRNVHVAVEAWQLTRAQIPLDLVVVGTDQPPFGLGIAGGRLPDEDWADLLAGAAALLYPTAEEGFGLPALEAAASGTPVVCARVGALPEVLGDAAVWCDAITAEAFAAALMALLSDPIRAADVREAGLARVAAWSSWQEAADAHLAAYTRATR